MKEERLTTDSQNCTNLLSQKSVTKLLLNEKKCKLFELALIIIEYIQLFSQVILLTIKTSGNDLLSNELTSYVIKATDIVNVGYYIGAHEYILAEFTLVTLGIYIAIVYAFIIYIFISNARGGSSNSTIVSGVRLVLQLHGRVVAYFILICCIGWLKTNFNDLDKNNGAYTIGYGIFSIVILILNYILPISMWTVYSYRLPSKSILSASSYLSEKMILTQKNLHGVLFLILDSGYRVNTWVMWGCTLAIGLLQIRDFFIQLPNYNLDALFWKGAMIVITPTLNICLLAFNIQSASTDEPIDIVSWITSWIIVTIFVEVIYFSVFRRMLSEILVTPFTRLSQHRLIHKVQFSKQIRRYGIPFQPTSSSEKIWRLLLTSLDMNKEIDAHNLKDQEPDSITIFQSIDTLKAWSLKSLQECLLRYPKFDRLKLYCAYYFGKKLGLYSASLKILEGLEKETWQSSLQLSVQVLRMQLQNALKSKQGNVGETLNIPEYVDLTLKLKEIKNKMMEQADMQAEIYKEWKTEKFDIGKIQQYSMKADILKAAIETKFKQLQQNRPDFYVEPLILFAYYPIKINFNPDQYSKYIYLYNQKSLRYQDKLEDNKLTRESLYHNKNIELILSAKSADFGSVVSCSQNTLKFLGMYRTL